MTKLHDLSIYLGNICNFNCSYCDRRYVKSLGSQRMQPFHIPHLVAFLKTLPSYPEMISFHGGEPFVFVDMMDEILTRLKVELKYTPKVFIQTNGSLLQKHIGFLHKWKSQLFISISYDFSFQSDNRTQFEIEDALKLLNGMCIGVQLQYVMPLNNHKVFSLESIMAITEIWRKFSIQSLNLIPLRHIRGKDRFKVILNDLNIPFIIRELMKFVQVLYIYGVNVYIDGHSGDSIDKHYFDSHKQMILSPDGFIYPEYDFLEYRLEGSIIGSWFTNIIVNRSNPKQEENIVPKSCSTCSEFEHCGLKFLHSLFETVPNINKCQPFYCGITLLIKHLHTLKTQPTLFHHFSGDRL